MSPLTKTTLDALATTARTGLFARATAMLVLRDRKAVKGVYLGVSGGDHIFRDARGRVWAVDLVCASAALCVGLPPSKWEHPPRLE